MDMISGNLPPMMRLGKAVEPLPPTLFAGKPRISIDEGARGRRSRGSIQWRKKRPPQKNFHIRTLDNKLVCCVPVIPEHYRKLTLPDPQEPVQLLSTVQGSYLPYEEHPNVKSPPTRYSANKSKKKPATGIVPMPMKWMEMTEGLKTGKPKYPPRTHRRKSRRSRVSQHLTVDTAIGSHPAIAKDTGRGPAIDTAGLKPTATVPKGALLQKPLPQRLPSLPRKESRKESQRDLLPMSKLSIDLTDRTEMFNMHAPPGPKWRSHWVGPL